jgi:hypothetical protein
MTYSFFFTMKKTLALGLGLALIGASVISFTNASRDAYHVYMYQQGRQTHAPKAPQKRVRSFSRRMGAFKQPRMYRRDTERRGVNPSQNTRYLQGDIRNRESVQRSRLEIHNYRMVRPSSDRIVGGAQANAHRRDVMKFRRTVDAIEKFTTYENEKFSLKVPFGWKASDDNAHLFVHPRSDYSVKVRYVEKACTDTGFQACAITLSKDENHTNPLQKIAITGPIERQSHFYGTVLHKPLQTRTYTESFSAEVAGEDLYIARHFVADLEGGVYMVETRTAFKNAAQFLGVSKTVFDSFQVYPLDK